MMKKLNIDSLVHESWLFAARLCYKVQSSELAMSGHKNKTLSTVTSGDIYMLSAYKKNPTNQLELDWQDT